MLLRLRVVIFVGCCSLWLPVLDATELVREEPIPIQSILANPQAFNLRVVRLQGVVQSLERVPLRGACGGLDDASLFTLQDHTGQLTINDLGDCLSEGHSVRPLMIGFSVGDRVEVVVDVFLLFSPNFASSRLEGTLRWVKRLSD